MNLRYAAVIMAVFIVAGAAISCRHLPQPLPSGNSNNKYGGYPDEIGRIIITKCVDGCHDQHDAPVCDGLVLDTWEHMFDGTYGGAAVIPYSPEFSTLLYFINTDSANGPINVPTMPQNGTPLSAAEYKTLRDWIAKGAADRNGNIPFASNAATRQKIYMTMQGCDVLAVIDAEKKMVMRCIKLDQDHDNAPHAVHVSPDGEFVYVSMANGKNLKKISTATDQVIENIRLRLDPGYVGNWQAFNFFDTGKRIAITDYGGSLLTIDNGVVHGVSSDLSNPHGVVANPAGNILYVTSMAGNFIYKIPLDGSPPSDITVDGKARNKDSSSGFGLHDIILSPDSSKYFVTCQNTGEVRVMDMNTDQLLAVVPVSQQPQEMVISEKTHCLYVTCMEGPKIKIDSATFKGSVYAIDYDNYTIKGTITHLNQPHGLCIDNRSNQLYVANRNVSPDGPAPHHTGDCGTRNGYYTVYDLITLQQINDHKYEATPDAYSCDVRFKK